jgi:hypothetical protein
MPPLSLSPNLDRHSKGFENASKPKTKHFPSSNQTPPPNALLMRHFR